MSFFRRMRADPLRAGAILLVSLLLVGAVAWLAGILSSGPGPVTGTTASGTTASGTPASGTPASGTSASGTAASGTTAADTATAGTTAAGTTAAGAGAAPVDPAVERGRQLAEAMCARCHAIGPEGASPNPNSPPFREMFERLPQEGIEDTLLEGILMGHPPMPKIEFTNEQAGDLIAYMYSVARETPP
jgi:mono/diheme cytochrome c family protein